MCKDIGMGKLFAVFALVGFFIYVNPAFAEMTSTNFKIRWDSVTTGGSDTASSASFGLRDSVSGSAVGTGMSASFQVIDGYRAGIFDQILTFDILPQNMTDLRSVSARSGLVISTASTTGISVGDFVALIQNLGTSQISAVGKVTSIASGSSITVDAWSDNGTTPTIDGTNDYFSLLNGTSIAFGNLSASSVTTGIIAFQVSSELQNGYSVQMMQGGNLISGSDDINSVADGSVTAGSEEYGAISSDVTLAGSTFDTQDTAVSSSFQDVTTESAVKFNDRHFVTLKASMASGTVSGTYTQTLTLIASGNF